MTNTYRLNLGERIRRERKYKGMTLAGLGSLVGISAMGLSYYENGQRKIKIETLEKIAEVLELSINNLIMDSEVRPDNQPWVCPVCGCGNAFWNKTCQNCMDTKTQIVYR